MGIEMQTPLYVKTITLIGAFLVVFVMAAFELVNRWIASLGKSVARLFHIKTKRPLRTA